MSVSIDDQKLLLVIINEYSQDHFPKFSNNYFLLEMTVVLAKQLWNKSGYLIWKLLLQRILFLNYG